MKHLHVKTFTELGEIAKSKGLRENAEVTIAILRPFIIRSFLYKNV